MARIVDPTKVVLFLAEAVVATEEAKEETKEVTKQEARVPTEVVQVPLEFLAVPQVVVKLGPHRVDVVAHHRADAAKAKPRVDEAQRKGDVAQPKEEDKAQTKVDQDPTWEEAEEEDEGRGRMPVERRDDRDGDRGRMERRDDYIAKRMRRF